MFGSAVLDLVLGLLAVYVLLGAITAFLTEVILVLLRWPARNLTLALEGTFGAPLAEKIQNSSLYAKRPLGSIPAGAFTAVLVEVLDGGTGSVISATHPARPSDAVRFVHAVAGGAQIRWKAGLEALVLSAMNQARRNSRQLALVVALGVALLLTVALDVDTLAFGTVFWQEQAARAAVTGAAQAASGTGLEDAFNALSQFDLTAGWVTPPQTKSAWLLKIIGLALTTLGVWVLGTVAGEIRARLSSAGRSATGVQTRAEAERWELFLGLPGPASK
jgi:hypothetical protein